MKYQTRNRFLKLTTVLLPAFVLSLSPLSHAATGTWSDTGTGPNNWSNTARWTGAIVGDGATFTANFSSNITALTTVTLDSNRTIGNVTFSDNAAGGSTWLLNGSSTLTLDNSTSQAIITKTTNAILSAPLAGSNIRFNGGAGATITGNNTGITGTFTFGGTNGLNISNSNAFGSATLSLASGEVLGGTTPGISLSNNLNSSSTYYQGSWGLTLNGTLSLSGANQGFNTWAAITDTIQAGSVSIGANNLNVTGGASGGLVISGAITGTGGVVKTGSSTLTLSGANTYSGNTSVTAGRLNLTNTTNASAITITGATLGGEGSTTGNITLNAGTTLAFNPSTPNALTSTGTVDIAGATTLAFEPTLPLAEGSQTVDVLKYGTLSNYANLATPTGLRSATLSNDVSNSKVTLTFSTGTRTWNGNYSDWDLLTSEGWNEGDLKFANGDSVLFDDTALGYTVFIPANVTPASLTFNHSSSDYFLSGSGAITGSTSLFKTGSSTLNISNTNSFTGGTLLSAGTISFSNGGLGTRGAITLDGGTLLWASGNNQDLSHRLQFVSGKSAKIHTQSNVSFATAIGNSTSAILEKSGAGILTFANAYSPGTYTGGTIINGGTLSLGTGGTGAPTSNTSALGTGAVTVNTGGTLRLWIQNSNTYTFTNNLILNGGRLHGEDGNYNINGPISIGSSGGTFSGVWSGKNLSINSVISGNGPVTVEAGSSQVRFFNNMTYTGATTVSTGSLLLNGTDATSGYSVASGASLVLRSANISGNITGAGTVTKDISTYGDSTVRGNNNTYTGPTVVNISRFTVGATGVINGTSSITIQAQWSANFNNLGSVTTPGAISVAGTGNNTGGGLFTDSSFFRNSGTVQAANLNLNSSASTNTTANRGGTFSQTAGNTTITTAVTLAANGGTGAPGTAGNDAALNLSGGTFATPSIELNAGTLTLTGGTLTLGASGINTTASNLVALNLGETTLAASSAWSTPVAATLNGTATGTTVNTSGGAITLNGALSGNGKLVKAGTGSLLINGTNTYSGSTTVNAGILGGKGSPNSALAVQSGATLAPGSSIGTFTASSATFVSGSIFAAEINSTSTTSDQLTASGAVNLGGATLSLIDLGSGTPANGTKFTLIDYTGGSLTGTFNGLAQGTSITIGSNTYTLSYQDSSKVTLTTANAVAGYDSWKAQITNTSLRERGDDPDSDGLTNLQEFLFGTNPNTGTDTTVTSETSGNQLILRWYQREAGSTYLLKESTTLESNSWTTSNLSPALDSNQSGTPADYDRWSVTIPLTHARKFFRIVGSEN